MADENTRNVVRVDNGKPRANPLRVHRMVGNPDEKGMTEVLVRQTLKTYDEFIEISPDEFQLKSIAIKEET